MSKVNLIVSDGMLQEVRKAAEASVHTASSQPGFAIALLKVRSRPIICSEDNDWADCLIGWTITEANAVKGGCRPANAQVVAADVPVEIRQAAAVNFKNFVKFRWVRKLPPSKSC